MGKTARLELGLCRVTLCRGGMFVARSLIRFWRRFLLASAMENRSGILVGFRGSYMASGNLSRHLVCVHKTILRDSIRLCKPCHSRNQYHSYHFSNFGQNLFNLDPA